MQLSGRITRPQVFNPLITSQVSLLASYTLRSSFLLPPPWLFRGSLRLRWRLCRWAIPEKVDDPREWGPVNRCRGWVDVDAISPCHADRVFNPSTRLARNSAWERRASASAWSSSLCCHCPLRCILTASIPGCQWLSKRLFSIAFTSASIVIIPFCISSTLPTARRSRNFACFSAVFTGLRSEEPLEGWSWIALSAMQSSTVAWRSWQGTFPEVP